MITATLEKYSFDIADYHQMIKNHIFRSETRVELIEGEIIKMAAMGPLHADIIGTLNDLFHDAVKTQAKIRVQTPIILGDLSEPEPDLALVQFRRYLDKHPTVEDIFLLLEVADSSFKADSQTKIPLYAKHGIPEVWLIDVKNTCVKVHRKPTAKGYKVVELFELGEQITPTLLTDIVINVDDIF